MEKIKNIYGQIEKQYEDCLYKKTCLDYVYLVILGIYLLFYFADTTMFEIMWPSNFAWVLRLITMMVVLLKFLSYKNNVELKDAVLIFSTMIIFLAVWHRTGYTILYDTALLLVGAFRINYKKILKVYLIICFPFSIYTIIASQIGIVTNLVYNQHGRIRESFGFIYPTDFAAHVFYIFVAWVLIREFKCSIIELLIMVFAVILLNIFSDTRCSEITIVLLILGVLFLKLKNKFGINKKIEKFFCEIFKIVCMIIPFMAAVFMILLCRFYNPSNTVMAAVNNILSQRLKLGKKIFDYYDVQMWGQYILMAGNGGSLEQPEDYTFIDCSYMNILMRFGILIFCIVIFMLWFIMIKNYNNPFILGALFLICIHSMIEHHLFEFYYNIFIILALAQFDERSIGQTNIGTFKYIKNKIRIGWKCTN